jgi:hypothetical protein
VRGQQFNIHQGQPASGQCPLGGPHRREERGQCRNATFAGRRADIHRRFDTQTPDTAVDGVLQQVPVVARDFDDPRLRPEFPQPGPIDPTRVADPASEGEELGGQAPLNKAGKGDVHIGVVAVVKGETHGRALHRQVEHGLELRDVDPCHRFTGIELTRVRTHSVHGEVGDPGSPISKHRCLPGSHRPLSMLSICNVG